MRRIALLISLLLMSFPVIAQSSGRFSVSDLYSNGAVLQQKSEVTVWGESLPGAEVQISASWGQREIAVADAKGNWSSILKTPAGSYKSYTIILESCGKRILIDDILVGEVWLASGQSNMEMSFHEDPNNNIKVEGAAGVINGPEDRYLRCFNVARSEKFYPQESVPMNGGWKSKNSKDVVWFSAVGYFYAAKLREVLNLPVGIINASYGGSPVESWIPGDFAKGAIYNDKRVEREDEIAFGALGRDEAVKRFRSWIDDSQRGKSDSLAMEFSDGLNVLNLPNYFFNTPRGGELGGTFLYKKIELDASHDLTLSLPQIDRNCQIFFNGNLVYEAILPSEAYRHPRVNIPSRMTRKGVNLLSVNMITTLWNGGIIGNREEMNISYADKTISLAGEWYYKKTFDLYSVKRVPYEGLPNAFLISSLYNGMINPLVKYSVRGVLWYQGEANISNRDLYPEMLSDLVKGWRSAWGKNLPFYYVQIAPWKGNGHNLSEYSQMRAIMSSAYRGIGNADVVITTDLGDPLNIHPPRKREVGERLALKALTKTYGLSSYSADYPALHKAVVKGDSITLTLRNLYDGIVVTDKESLFEISGDGQIYYPATFRIEGNRVILYCKNVKKALFLRYAFRNSMSGNILNSKMLPLDLFEVKLCDLE